MNDSHLLWRLRSNDAAKHLCAIAGDAIERLQADKDMAYRERNQVVAALASFFPAGIARTEIPGWDPEWHGCVYIDLPSGQVSWHYHDSEAHLFHHLPSYAGQWDGHSTNEKYDRLAAFCRHGAPAVRPEGGAT